MENKKPPSLLLSLGVLIAAVTVISFLLIAAYWINISEVWLGAVTIAYWLTVMSVRLFYDRNLAFNLSVIGLAMTLIGLAYAVANWLNTTLAWVIGGVFIFCIVGATMIIIEYDNMPRGTDTTDLENFDNNQTFE